MNNIVQIPTEKNVSRLWEDFRVAIIRRNEGLPVSAKEVLTKELVFTEALKRL